jgi:hypothetical protein
MSATGGGLPAGGTTLIFDVLGTVVDEAGSVAAETARTLAAAGAGPAPASPGGDQAPIDDLLWSRGAVPARRGHRLHLQPPGVGPAR